MISNICRHKLNRVSQHCFTLVELLVAMVILVVMMGFLFQFTIGAQRIWAATTSDDEAFQSAQIVMQVMSEDLENIIFVPTSTDEENEDNIPLYYDSSSNVVCFMTSGRDCDDVPSFVIYDYDTAKKELYRTVIKKSVGVCQPMGLLGFDGTGSNSFINDMLNDAKASSTNNTRELVCEKVSNFEFKVSPGVTSGYLVGQYPKAFQVNFTIEQEERKDAKPGKFRHFSKTIFLSKYKDVFHI